MIHSQSHVTVNQEICHNFEQGHSPKCGSGIRCWSAL